MCGKTVHLYVALWHYVLYFERLENRYIDSDNFV